MNGGTRIGLSRPPSLFACPTLVASGIVLLLTAVMIDGYVDILFAGLKIKVERKLQRYLKIKIGATYSKIGI